MKSQKMAQFHDVINLPWLIHNHPSGDPTPSRDDITMTKAIQLACEALRITVHDHVVIGGGRWVSFRQEGLL